jgi:hypothetical protein
VGGWPWVQGGVLAVVDGDFGRVVDNDVWLVMGSGGVRDGGEQKSGDVPV